MTMKHIAEAFEEFDFDESFKLEPFSDPNTMYCEADVIELTGWNSQIIAEQVQEGWLPKPINPGSRAPVWRRWEVDWHYRSLIAIPPSAEEEEKIERHRDIYEQVYQSALADPVFLHELLEKEARSEADRMVREHCHDEDEDEDEDDEAEAWDYFYERAYEDEDLAELSARFKARQAVRFRD
jgi:predicted DNA-binding transcriptional regulator AlpA